MNISWRQLGNEWSLHSPSTSAAPIIQKEIGTFPSFTLFFFNFWQRILSNLSPFGNSPFSINLHPLLPFHPTVILPLLTPLNILCPIANSPADTGMTKTVSHPFEAHLYPLHKCIRHSLLMEQKTSNGTFLLWLRVMFMNTNYFSVLYGYKSYWSIELACPYAKWISSLLPRKI